MILLRILIVQVSFSKSHPELDIVPFHCEESFADVSFLEENVRKSKKGKSMREESSECSRCHHRNQKSNM
jgi:hypothetical protein